MTPLDDIAILFASAMGALTALGLGGFRFARWSLQHEARQDPERAARRAETFEERRRILERKREHAINNARNAKTYENNVAWGDIATKAEKELLVLAAEEADDA